MSRPNFPPGGFVRNPDRDDREKHKGKCMKHHFADFLDRVGDYWTIVPNRERYAYRADGEIENKKEVKILTITGKDAHWQQVFDANMGKDFEAPKKGDVKAWRHLRRLYSVGIAFHSCGCTGPGYIPADRECLIEYLMGIKADYEDHLKFWRERPEPQDRREIDRDKTQNWPRINSVPPELKDKKGSVRNADAVDYWIGQIREVENRISHA